MIGLGVAQAYAALGRVDPVLAIWGVEFLGELNDWPPEKVERLRSHYLARVVQGKGA